MARVKATDLQDKANGQGSSVKSNLQPGLAKQNADQLRISNAQPAKEDAQHKPTKGTGK